MHPIRFALAATLLVTTLTATGCGRSGDSADPPSRQPGAAVTIDPGSVQPGGLVVDFEDGTTKAQFDAWERDWGVDLEFNSVEGPKTGITLALGVEDVAGLAERIRRHPAVESAEPLHTYERMFTPNDPQYASQWNLELIGMPKAWEVTRGKGVVVAVIDTGIAYEDRDEFRQVPDLKGTRFARGYDFVNDDGHANDDHGHGTHVGGTIAQATNNQEGVAGIAFEATLMPLKVLNHFGSGNAADIAEAIRFAADHGAKVINLSLGGPFPSKVMADAVAHARARGTTVVAAAGNTGAGRVSYPAAYPGVISVGAVGPDGTRAPYSSYGKDLKIAAPGGDKRRGVAGGILQNTLDRRDYTKAVYEAYQGTSMAAPHVAGVAALLHSAGAKGPDEVEKALFAGARRVGGLAWSDQYGHGLLDAAGALGALGASAPSAEVRWNPLLWALVLLAGVLLTLQPRLRPGYLNLLVKPAFLLPLILSTVGAFFLRWVLDLLGLGSGGAIAGLAAPIPDWDEIVFGRGKLANPLFYSALLPALLALPAAKFCGLRDLAGGLCLGFAAFLGYALWAQAPALAWMPFTFLAIPWLALNALVCVVMARALIRKEGRV